jgi:hypothetical protein
MDVACWHCGAAIARDEVPSRAHLVPRSAREGGPVLLLRCRACDVESVVERNPADELLLTPPPVLGYRSSTVRGDVRYAARKWAAEHEADRRRFLAGEGRPGGEWHPRGDTDVTPGAPREESGIASVIEAWGVLGLAAGASAERVRERYRKLAREVHPDLAPEREREFRRLVAAYELITREMGRADPREPPDSR